MNPFEMPCPNCKYAGDDCALLQGECGHYFHMHCIYKWLEQNNCCPYDRRPWKEKKLEAFGDSAAVQPGQNPSPPQSTGLFNLNPISN